MTDLTADEVRSMYDYDPLSGLLTRRFGSGGRKAGSVVGNVGADGRVQMYVNGRNYKAHRVIWLYVTGEWPRHDVDHIDGNPSNNRWNNLRDVPHHVNLQNRRTHTKHNQLRVIGVTPNKGRFGAQIKLNGKRIWLGTFDTPEEASAVYLESKRKLHAGCTV